MGSEIHHSTMYLVHLNCITRPYTAQQKFSNSLQSLRWLTENGSLNYQIGNLLSFGFKLGDAISTDPFNIVSCQAAKHHSAREKTKTALAGGENPLSTHIVESHNIHTCMGL